MRRVIVLLAAAVTILPALLIVTPADAAPIADVGTATADVRSSYRDAAGITHVVEWMPAPM
jgi:hypothetical protein